MTQVLSDYFFAFLHPFKVQKLYRQQNLRKPAVTLVGEVSSDEVSTLSFTESLAISWGLVLLQAILILASLPLGAYVVETMVNNMELENEFVSKLITRWEFFWVFSLLIQAVVFPAFTWFYMKFWTVLIRFFVDLFQVKEVTEKSLEQVISVALACHTFLIVPIFGPMLKHWAFLVYLFAGLRENLGMTRAQSLVVLLSPIFVLLLLGLMVFIYFVILISAI